LPGYVSAHGKHLGKGTGDPGQLLEVGSLNYSTGGLVSNTGLALHRLGVKVGLMAKVGDDLIGQTITNSLKARNPPLTLFLSGQPGQVGSYTIVLSLERSDRTFCTAPVRTLAIHPMTSITRLLQTQRYFILAIRRCCPVSSKMTGRD